ncbi:MAG: glycosyltransferase family 2 protein [Minicystis sp.]
MSRPLPRITVVTPAYQQIAYIEETLRSVVEQGYPDLELIVLDGGSTDGTVDVIRRYESKIAHWQSARDKGPYDAVERGFARATGEVLCWLNSSDVYFPWTLRTVGSLFAELPEVEWITSLQPVRADVTAMCAIIGRDPGFSREAFLDGRFIGHRPALRTVGQRGWIQQEATFWRRSLWERSGGTIGQYKLAADFNLWARFYEHADLVGVDAPLALFRVHPEQRSGHMDRYCAEATSSLARLREALGWQLPRARAAAYRARLPRVPGLAEALAPALGYRGKRAVRRAGADGVARWVCEEHAFF